METLELTEFEVRELTRQILNGSISGKILHLDALCEVEELLASEINNLKRIKKTDRQSKLSALEHIYIMYKIDMDFEGDEILSLFSETHNQISKISKMRMDEFLNIIEERNAIARYFSKSGEKSFSDYLIIQPENIKEEFAQRLREEFRNEKGLTIRYMVEALKKLGLMVLTDRQRMALYRAMTVFFNWDIGKYQGIFNMKQGDLNEQNNEDTQKRVQHIIGNLQLAKP